MSLKPRSSQLALRTGVKHKQQQRESLYEPESHAIHAPSGLPTSNQNAIPHSTKTRWGLGGATAAAAGESEPAISVATIISSAAVEAIARPPRRPSRACRSAPAPRARRASVSTVRTHVRSASR
eukprot:COSAG02_NODE_3890_length_6075_cov_3.820448_2_plen_124_part_00